MRNSGNLFLPPSLAALLVREEHGSLEPGQGLCLKTFSMDLGTQQGDAAAPTSQQDQAPGRGCHGCLPPTLMEEKCVCPSSEVSCSPGMKHLDGSIPVPDPAGSHQQKQGEIIP